MVSISPTILFLTVLLVATSSLNDQVVKEDLFITHLPDARIAAHFEFSATWDIHPLILAQDFKGMICPSQPLLLLAMMNLLVKSCYVHYQFC